MPAPSALAASCVALSSAVVQTLSDAGNFARRVRDARHTIGSINAELLAIKTSLEIAHDDFASTSTSLSTPLLESFAGILECCGQINDQVHKAIITLASSSFARSEAWDTEGKAGLAKHKRYLEAQHVVLDIALDHNSIQMLPFLHSTSSGARGHTLGLSRDAIRVGAILARIDAQGQRFAGHTEGPLLKLDCWLAELRMCVETTRTELMAGEARPERSYSPLPLPTYPPFKRNDSAQGSVQSISGASDMGIGAWLVNVASHAQETKTIDDPKKIAINKMRTGEDRQPSRSTFYTESSTAGSIRTTKIVQRKSRSKSAQPQPVLDVGKTRKCKHFATSTNTGTTLSSCGHRNIDADKVAIARANRIELGADRTVALDRDLRNIGRIAMHVTSVERMLFQGADPNVADPEFGSLFIRAAFEMSTAVLRLLVEYGADITKTSPTKYFSSLHAAVLGSELGNVDYLIELGIPIDFINTSGETPLHLAAKTPGAYTIAKYLLEMGADVNAYAQGAGTPLQQVLVATKLDSRERSTMVELLITHGATGELDKEGGKRRGKGLSVLGLI